MAVRVEGGAGGLFELAVFDGRGDATGQTADWWRAATRERNVSDAW